MGKSSRKQDDSKRLWKDLEKLIRSNSLQDDILSWSERKGYSESKSHDYDTVDKTEFVKLSQRFLNRVKSEYSERGFQTPELLDYVGTDSFKDKLKGNMTYRFMCVPDTDYKIRLASITFAVTNHFQEELISERRKNLSKDSSNKDRDNST